MNVIVDIIPEQFEEMTLPDLLNPIKEGTIIHALVFDNLDELVQSLTLSRSDPNSFIEDDISFLDFSAKHNSLKCFDYLLSKGAKITKNTLRYSLFSDNTQLIEKILTKVQMTNSTIDTCILTHNMKLATWIRDTKKIAPMFHDCARLYDFNLMFDKINRKNNVNFVDKESNTVLNALARFGVTFLVKTFIDFGAKPNLLPPNGSLPLVDAVVSGFLDTVICLIKCGAEINVTDKDGLTIQHYSCFGTLDVVKYFYEKEHLPYDVVDSVENWTPIFYAVKYGKFDIVNYLLDKKENIKIKDKNKRSLLRVAVEYKQPSIVHLLLMKGEMDPNEKWANGLTLLMQSIDNNDEDTAIRLVEYGAEFNKADKDKKYPLIQALYKGHFDLAVEMILRKANVNCADRTGMTPLGVCCKYGDYDMAKILIERGANINCDLGNGMNILYMAATSQNFDIVELLAGNNVDMNQRQTLLAPPLNIIVTYEKYDLLKKMLQIKPCNIDYTGIGEVNALMASVEMNLCEAVNILLDYGANIEFVTKTEKDTPLLRCCRFDCSDVLKVLIRRGARLDVKCAGGFSPVHLASSTNSFNSLKVLIDNGCDINVKHSQGLNALGMACTQGALGSVKTLLKAGIDVNSLNSLVILHLFTSEENMSDISTKIICFLIKYGLNVNVAYEGGITIKELALSKKNNEVLRYLIRYDRDPMIRLLGSNFDLIANQLMQLPPSFDEDDWEDMGELQYHGKPVSTGKGKPVRGKENTDDFPLPFQMGGSGDGSAPDIGQALGSLLKFFKK